MSTLVKIVVALGLVLPLGAFVVGSLAASGAEDPGPRQTIVLHDSPTRSASRHEDRSPADRPTEDTHGGPEVVTPSVHDLGDDHGGRRGGDDSSSGPPSGGGQGSGQDSGHGGGGHGSDDSGGGGHG